MSPSDTGIPTCPPGPAVVRVGTVADELNALAAALPHARLVEVPAGHMLSLEEPGTLAAAVRSLTAPSEAPAP